MSYALAETVITRHAERVKPDLKCITIDMDPTDDPTYGQQQMSFFNAHYDNYCYLPMACFLQFDEELDQYLFAYVLRPGDVSASFGAVALLSRTIKQLKQEFSDTIIRVRLDGGFANAELFDLLDDEGVEYAVSMGKNAKRRNATVNVSMRQEAGAKSVGLFLKLRYCATAVVSLRTILDSW